MSERWRVDGAEIVWDVAKDTDLPHEDHIEMSGRKVSVIVRYRVDENRRLHLTRQVIWPMLRIKEGDVRGYLRRTYEGVVQAPIFVNGKLWKPGAVSQIRFDGTLVIEFAPEGDHRSSLVISPEGNKVETQVVFQPSQEKIDIALEGDTKAVETDSGVYGAYQIATEAVYEAHGKTGTVTESVSAYIEQSTESISSRSRQQLITGLHQRLILETPDEALNTAFAFAKLRAAESLFETKMGLVHSPGGGRYYGGVWNNDQCEYSGPFFGYLGDADAQLAALNAYRNFVAYMTDAYEPIPSSLEMEGTIPWCGARDRGDAAMYASGAARFALSVGDNTLAEELYGPISWCLEYCRRQVDERGVVRSDSDELENRFPSGDANLSTACLCYDGLRRSGALARSLARVDDAKEFDLRADDLAKAIESHFGVEVEEFQTYRYYEGNTTLRAWICLPLVFGLSDGDRTKGTLDALFSSRLWSIDGLATEAGKPDFWDRSTLYALRGAFVAGDTERAFEYLMSFTRRRLLGEHVPYAVEAYPEGGQAHLSAESALYGRVIVEGMFGFIPTGLRSFSLTPRLPATWDRMALRRIHAFGTEFDIEVTRAESGLTVTVKGDDENAFAVDSNDQTGVYLVAL